jgi:universal stress protein E
VHDEARDGRAASGGGADHQPPQLEDPQHSLDFLARSGDGGADLAHSYQAVRSAGAKSSEGFFNLPFEGTWGIRHIAPFRAPSFRAARITNAAPASMRPNWRIVGSDKGRHRLNLVHTTDCSDGGGDTPPPADPRADADRLGEIHPDPPVSGGANSTRALPGTIIEAMETIARILVGVDFSSCSADALRQAVRIAGWHRARCTAYHVIELLVVSELEETLGLYQPNLAQELIAEAKLSWDRFVKSIDLGAGVEFEAQIGNPVAWMIAAAREQKADLMVLGVHGSSERSGAGHVATACVRHSPCKTMLVRGGAGAPFRTVAACVDFSPTSMEALRQAVRIATQDSAKLVVVHVFDPPWARLHYRAPTPQATADFKDQYTRALRSHLEAFCEPLKHELGYLRAQLHLAASGSHGKGIVDFVRESGSDLVVLGTRGRTNLRDLVMGSTAERVVRDAPCSILAVRPE